MAFVSGNIIASQEGGGLLLLTDSDNDGIHDRVTSYNDQIVNAQGILALGTRTFVVGDGPEGMALYRLRDADRNGQLSFEEWASATLRRFAQADANNDRALNRAESATTAPRQRRTASAARCDCTNRGAARAVR